MPNNKPFFIILVTALIVITIIFLWKENSINIAERINYEKFSSYFTSIGAIITAFSLYFIYFQLAESRKQNNFSIRPQLFVEQKTFKMKEVEDTTISNGYVNIETKDTDPKDEWGIRVINVGNGTALKVEAEWIFNMNEVKAITEPYYSSRLETVINYRKFRDYLRTNDTLNIGLPFVYLNLFGSKLFPDHDKGKYVELLYKPELKIRLKYLDLEHKRYESFFAVSINSDTIFLYLEVQQFDSSSN